MKNEYDFSNATTAKQIPHLNRLREQQKFKKLHIKIKKANHYWSSYAKNYHFT